MDLSPLELERTPRPEAVHAGRSGFGKSYTDCCTGAKASTKIGTLSPAEAL
jgi:hypothetical protein